MPKPSFQDIIPSERRSIKKIPLPEREQEKEDFAEENPRHHREKKKRGKKSRILLSIVLILIIVGVSYFVTTAIPGAVITLIPRTQNVAVDVSLTASSNPNGELPFQTVSYQKDGKLAVPASGEENAQVKASGVIRIFNNFSASPQKLIANTRFETDGKIFRVKNAVTIPGMVGKTAGSVDVTVIADDVGERYNVGLADFTIPGFKGDPRYEKIFARSVDSISGGFSGMRKKIDQNVLSDARKKIRSELESNFVKQVKQNIPSNFVFPDNAYFMSFESLPNGTSTEGAVVIERATFHGIIFRKSDLSKVLAGKISNPSFGSSTFSGIENLKFSSKSSSVSKPWQSSSFDFYLKGTTTLISNIDIESLKIDLIGKSRSDLSVVLSRYSGIEKAEVMMKPFWNQSFPTDIKSLKINIASTTNPL